MGEPALMMTGLALGTLMIRLGGFLLGARLPRSGPWARGFAALPGCLIAALLATMLGQAGAQEWLAAAMALLVALLSRNLPLTMLAGIVTLSLLRSLG